jgi:nitroreductase
MTTVEAAAKARAGMTIEEAIRGRRSTRAFLKTPVPREIIARILETAGRAPSGSNIQPWHVYVLSPAVKTEISRELLEIYNSKGEGERGYNYYPVNWRDPYISRRRACGWGLYSTLGITREDKAGMHRQKGENYDFFGAPNALIFTIDKDLEIGSWLDMGMFIQSFMVAARQFGLETCAQAALCNFHSVLKPRLGIGEGETVVCGMALGYPDTAAKVNTFVTDREPIGVFTRWVDEVKR